MTSALAFKISKSILKTPPPPIPQARRWAAMYNPLNNGERPLLNMSQGVPGTPPPQSLLSALSQAAGSPDSCGYCPVPGETTLRAALAQEMKVVYGKDAVVNAEDVILTAGCNMAFVAAAMSVAGAGDDLIIPVPWYFNIQMSLSVLGITTVCLPTLASESFLPSPERCERLITPKTKAIVLVTPNNPTGAIYPSSLITSFAILARKHGLALILDETYRDLVPPSSWPPHRLFSPPNQTSNEQQSESEPLPSDWSWHSTVIHLFSFSKSYHIPGHRLGAIVCPPALQHALEIVLDNLQICAPRPVQLALASAAYPTADSVSPVPHIPLLQTLRTFINTTAKALEHRHALFRSLLPQSWKVGSQGGYYAFVRHPFQFAAPSPVNAPSGLSNSKRWVSSEEMSQRLAIQMGVVSLPGAFFMPPKSAYLAPEEESLIRVPEASDPKDLEDRSDRWIRFSVANVGDDDVRLVCNRLRECEEVFGKSKDVEVAAGVTVGWGAWEVVENTPVLSGAPEARRPSIKGV